MKETNKEALIEEILTYYPKSLKIPRKLRNMSIERLQKLLNTLQIIENSFI